MIHSNQTAFKRRTGVFAVPSPVAVLIEAASPSFYVYGVVSLRRFKQLANGPNVIGDSSRHSWSGAQGLVNATEVVKRKPEHDGCAVVDEFLAEAVGQPGETAHPHPHRKILTLYMAGADALRVGIAYAHHGLSADDLSWRIAALPFGSGPVDCDSVGED